MHATREKVMNTQDETAMMILSEKNYVSMKNESDKLVMDDGKQFADDTTTDGIYLQGAVESIDENTLDKEITHVANTLTKRTVKKDVITYTKEQVAKHNTKEDCWIIINNLVYDVTKWIPIHPGGESLILNLGGGDVTDEFKVFHLDPNYKRLKIYQIGQLAEIDRKPTTELTKDIDNLVQDLRKKGAFDTDYWMYFRLSAIIIGLFSVSLYCLQFTESKLAIFAGALAMGMFWQQLAFIGHDLGHHVVTHNAKLDDLISIFFGNLIQGISLEWWKHNHNTHHVVTNSIEYDPDIQHLPFFAVSKEFFKSQWSKYYHRVMKFDAAARFFVSYQHYLFYVVMSLARFNLYAQSFIYNLAGPGSRTSNKRKQIQELASLAGFWVWMGCLLYSLGSFSNIMLFLLVSHATAGLVHVQITINHFSMEAYQGIPQSHFEGDGYVKSQLSSTTNIDCPPWLDWLQGGLQFQIEHHLFPHTTRSQFRYVKARVMDICVKHDIPYYSKSFWRANYDVLCHLKKRAKEAQLSTMFWDGINMVG